MGKLMILTGPCSIAKLVIAKGYQLTSEFQIVVKSWEGIPLFEWRPTMNLHLTWPSLFLLRLVILFVQQQSHRSWDISLIYHQFGSAQKSQKIHIYNYKGHGRANAIFVLSQSWTSWKKCLENSIQKQPGSGPVCASTICLGKFL